MTKRAKLIQSMRQNPKNVRFADLTNVLEAFGFKPRQGKGSHTIYTFGPHRITVPFRKPFVLPVYVEHVLNLVDEITESEAQSDEKEGNDEN